MDAIKVKYVVAVFALMLATAAQPAWSIVVGPNPGGGGSPNPESQLYFQGPVYTIEPDFTAAPNYSLPPVDVDHSTGGPYWLKMLNADDGDGVNDADDRPTIMINDYLVIRETLTVAGTPGWDDWHETIVVEGWSWIKAAIYISGTTDLIPGLQAVRSKGDPFDPHFEVMNFYFDTLVPGTVIDIIKVMQFQGFDTPSPNDNWGSDDIIIREYPTVIPEPATLGLIALGGSLLGFLSRKRR